MSCNHDHLKCTNNVLTCLDCGAVLPLELLPPETLKIFREADVIISKGQANVETLLDTDHGFNIYYAFLVKCKRFIDRFGKAKLTPMLVHDHK